MINRSDLEDLEPKFLDWLYETEVYSSRFERLQEDCNPQNLGYLLRWLYAAYLLGKKGT